MTSWRRYDQGLSFAHGDPMKLNLGSGQNRKDGYVNIDKYPTFAPDLVWDLEQTPWPFEAGSVEAISACHVLEHLGATPEVFLAVMKELHRVLAPGGKVEIRVPHHQSDGFWGDPTHVRAINPAVLSLFSKENCRMFAARGWPNTPLADYLDVDLVLENLTYNLLPDWKERFAKGALTREELDQAIASQWNVVDEVVMVLRKV